MQSANQPGSPRDKAAALDEFKEATAELEEVTKEHKQLLIELRRAEPTYEKQLVKRRKYRLKPKGRIKPDGTRQYIVPDTSKILFAKPQRYTQKTVLIEADITADKNPGGLRREQHLEYGFDFWRKVYAKRNGVEALNRNVKRSQYEAIADADRRHVRGNTFTYVVVTVAVVCQNIRQILNFLKERLAIRSLSPKNADIWVNFWEPEPRSVEVDPPHRC